MARRFPSLTWAGSFRDLNSLLVSAICHLTLLVALGLLVAAGQTKSPGVKLAVDLTDGTDLPASDDSVLQEAVRGEVAAGGDAGAVEAANDVAGLGSVQMFGDGGVSAGEIGSLDPLTEMSTGDRGGNGPALADFGVGDGAGGSKKKDGKAATEFFGVSGYGQTFVYIVDCSGSMRENGKFERALYELLKSIEQLQSDQLYYIIFYNHRAYPMDEPRLVLATPDHFEKTRAWIGHVRPQGGTVPLPALLAALSMKPDAIFFLSDGLFDPATGREVQMHNHGKKRQIPIHTIAFVNRENEGLMQAIARNSGGDYRYVP